MGYLRLLLSLIILFVHTTLPQGHAVASNAVFIFFILSGYGCTAAMNTKYKDKPFTFLLNRYLRLWPSYLIVFALSSLAWSITGDLYNIGIPIGLDWLGQLSMLWMPDLRLVPTAWVIPYLFLGYLAIALGATKNLNRTLFWLFFGTTWMQHDVLILYGAPYAGSLSVYVFSIAVGSAVYWLNPSIPNLSKWATDISFPVFLIHYLVLSIGIKIGIQHGLILFLLTTTVTLILSQILVTFVERPITQYRKSIAIHH
jgi:peptidoglycan/LPS O-acetylase OafA/YrhL